MKKRRNIILIAAFVTMCMVSGIMVYGFTKSMGIVQYARALGFAFMTYVVLNITVHITECRYRKSLENTLKDEGKEEVSC